MQRTLPLAVDIADTIRGAAERHARFDVSAKARELARRHPEVEVTSNELAEMLQEELDGVGLGVVEMRVSH